MHRRTFIASTALLGLGGGAAARAQPAGPAFTTDAQITLAACRGLVEEHLAGTLRTLKALAVSSDARSGDWDRIRPLLQEAGGDLPTAAAVWYALSDGHFYTAAAGFQPDAVRDRPYFPGLMAGGDVRSALVVSKSTGHRSTVAAAPIRRDGRVIGALGASVRARLISQMVDEAARLPDDLVFYALDAAGQTAIHKDPARMFEHPSDMGDPSLAAAVKTILGAPEGVVAYEFQGSRRTAVFQRSKTLGWTFVLARVGG